MEEQANIVFALATDSVLIGSIAFVKDKVVKHNQGKFSNLARFTTESFVEYVLEEGIKAVDNAVDADVKRRNEKHYIDAMATLTVKEDATLEDLQKYQKQVAALRRKYGIGGDQKQV